MLKILIVDDELLVCEGIRDLLMNANLGLTEIEIALNGFEALDYIRNDPPHVVITDIQMGGMNGVELMETVFLEQPGIPFLVISAHDEFEYAQKCMRLGAKDYIVKPVVPEQLLEVVGKLLKERQGYFSDYAINRKFSLEGVLSPQMYILSETFSNQQIDHRDLEELFESLELPLIGPYYSIVVVKIHFDPDKKLKDRNLFKYACMNVIEETIANWSGLAFHVSGNKIVVLLQWQEDIHHVSSDGAVSELNRIGNLLHYNIQTYLRLETTVGISRVGKGSNRIGELYHEAEDVIYWRKLHQEHAVYYTEDFNRASASRFVNWQQQIDLLAELWKKELSPESTRREIEQMLDSIEQIYDDQELYISFVSMAASRIYCVLLEFKDEIGDGIRPFDPRYCNEYMVPHDQRRASLIDFFFAAYQRLKECNENKDRTIIQQVLSFIQKSYRSKELNLHEIARVVHLSPNYMSYLFKKSMNINVWDYVIKLRMEEAHRLLLSTDKKRYEIADEIGYESPEHFGRIFRKYFDMSPNELRNRTEA
ncbi:response regulator transcription factor [Paenibacillus sp. FSL H8-0034]|uniref:response regulator transcription factor n=1 Tax=Paenibacillus sp. FSL H8-0034 TaxID=2954671 RepID=UPI0030F953A8